jgi:hypothetical protein
MNLRDFNEQLSKEILKQKVRGPSLAKQGYTPNEIEQAILTNDIAYVQFRQNQVK